MATDETFWSFMYQFRIHHITITNFIAQVLDVIYTVLKDDYLQRPTSQEDWIELADPTYKKWQFPNAYAAADTLLCFTRFILAPNLVITRDSLA